MLSLLRQMRCVVGALGRAVGSAWSDAKPLKTGTVTPDVANAVKNAKAGQVRFPR